MRGVGDVVAFRAVDERGRVGRLVVQVFDRSGLLLALVLDDACVGEDVDGCAAHLVDEIVGFDREVLRDLLAHQRRFTGDVHPAAAVLAVEQVRPVVGQHVGAGRLQQHQRCERPEPCEMAVGRDHAAANHGPGA
jgi:hypothetical protein